MGVDRTVARHAKHDLARAGVPVLQFHRTANFDVPTGRDQGIVMPIVINRDRIGSATDRIGEFRRRGGRGGATAKGKDPMAEFPANATAPTSSQPHPV